MECDSVPLPILNTIQNYNMESIQQIMDKSNGYYTCKAWDSLN